MTALAQVACPDCATGNRIAAGRDLSTAKCGRCGSALFTGTPIEVDDEDFARHLKLTKGAVLVDIWAPWCGPCRAMAPHFEEAARIFKGQVVFLKMNADECSTPATLGVRGIPALHLFLDGHPVSQQAGLMTTEALGKWINSSVFARSRT